MVGINCVYTTEVSAVIFHGCQSKKKKKNKKEFAVVLYVKVLPSFFKNEPLYLLVRRENEPTNASLVPSYM